MGRMRSPLRTIGVHDRARRCESGTASRTRSAAARPPAGRSSVISPSEPRVFAPPRTDCSVCVAFERSWLVCCTSPIFWLICTSASVEDCNCLRHFPLRVGVQLPAWRRRRSAVPGGPARAAASRLHQMIELAAPTAWRWAASEFCISCRTADSCVSERRLADRSISATTTIPGDSAASQTIGSSTFASETSLQARYDAKHSSANRACGEARSMMWTVAGSRLENSPDEPGHCVLKRQRVSLYCASEARYPSGKGEVCKTFIRGFDSHPRLQFPAFAFSKLTSIRLARHNHDFIFRYRVERGLIND